MILHDVLKQTTRHKKRKRVGRGIGSGLGKTCGRGHKGQGSRGGYSHKSVFQGGAMPLIRRIPKRGFNNRWAKQIAIVNLQDLEDAFSPGDEVSPTTLREKNLAKGRYDELKILGDGNLTKKFKVAAHRFSKSASEKIVAAGGEVVVLPGKTPVEHKKQAAKNP